MSWTASLARSSTRALQFRGCPHFALALSPLTLRQCLSSEHSDFIVERIGSNGAQNDAENLSGGERTRSEGGSATTTHIVSDTQRTRNATMMAASARPAASRLPQCIGSDQGAGAACGSNGWRRRRRRCWQRALRQSAVAAVTRQRACACACAYHEQSVDAHHDLSTHDQSNSHRTEFVSVGGRRCAALPLLSHAALGCCCRALVRICRTSVPSTGWFEAQTTRPWWREARGEREKAAGGAEQAAAARGTVVWCECERESESEQRHQRITLIRSRSLHRSLAANAPANGLNPGRLTQRRRRLLDCASSALCRRSCSTADEDRRDRNDPH